MRPTPATTCGRTVGQTVPELHGQRHLRHVHPGIAGHAQDPRCRLIRIHLAKEGALVGLAQGLDVVDIQARPAKLWADADKGDAFEELDDLMGRAGGRTNWLASMAQDVKKGRQSEIDYMNGLICRKGLESGNPDALQRRHRRRYARHRRRLVET